MLGCAGLTPTYEACWMAGAQRIPINAPVDIAVDIALLHPAYKLIKDIALSPAIKNYSAFLH